MRCRAARPGRRAIPRTRVRAMIGQAQVRQLRDRCRASGAGSVRCGETRTAPRSASARQPVAEHRDHQSRDRDDAFAAAAGQEATEHRADRQRDQEPAEHQRRVRRRHAQHGLAFELDEDERGQQGRTGEHARAERREEDDAIDLAQVEQLRPGLPLPETKSSSTMPPPAIAFQPQGGRTPFSGCWLLSAATNAPSATASRRPPTTSTRGGAYRCVLLIFSGRRSGPRPPRAPRAGC